MRPKWIVVCVFILGVAGFFAWKMEIGNDDEDIAIAVDRMEEVVRALLGEDHHAPT